ncbi:MAG: hypothetical protein HY820_30355 [Acidobacteria bacterium]|nr:hypothetical protein [Acidobacteriota bacterium]
MRLAWLALVLAAIPALAQQRGMYGGVSTGQMVGATSDPGFAGRLGATVSGLPQTTTSIPINGGIYGNTLPGGNFGGRSYGGRRGNTLVVPYGVPVLYANPFTGAYSPGYDVAPRAIAMPVDSSPTVVINQYFTPDTARPQMREYSDLPEPVRPPQTSRPRVAPQQQESQQPAPQPQAARRGENAPDKPTITLLAFNDKSVTSVIAYWVQKDELHYVTNTYKKMVVGLNSLDRATSERLNKERSVEFTLE